MSDITMSTIRALEAVNKERYTIEREPTPLGSVDPVRYVVVDHETGERYSAGRFERWAKILKAALIKDGEVDMQNMD